MKADRDPVAAKAANLQELPPAHHAGGESDFDLSLLEESLLKTPWERMLANDDALRLAELLQAAMKQRRAKLK